MKNLFTILKIIIATILLICGLGDENRNGS